MSLQIMFPSLSKQIVLRSFEVLTETELVCRTTTLPSEVERRLGFQNGYLRCLTDLFGGASEEDNESTWDAGKSYIHLLEDIFQMPQIANLKTLDGIVSPEIVSTIKQAVLEFSNLRSADMFTALRSL